MYFRGMYYGMPFLYTQGLPLIQALRAGGLRPLRYTLRLPEACFTGCLLGRPKEYILIALFSLNSKPLQGYGYQRCSLSAQNIQNTHRLPDESKTYMQNNFPIPQVVLGTRIWSGSPLTCIYSIKAPYSEQSMQRFSTSIPASGHKKSARPSRLQPSTRESRADSKKESLHELLDTVRQPSCSFFRFRVTELQCYDYKYGFCNCLKLFIFQKARRFMQ